MSVAISFVKLHATGWEGNESVRVPLEKMDSEEHIHGELKISWNGRVVPRLGYFGADDVCMNTWIQEFHAIVEALSKSETACYVFDEGEQGQPAYRFQREDDWVYLSIVASEISDGPGDPDFCDLKSEYTQFIEEIREFLKRFDAVMRQTNVKTYEKWLSEWFPNGVVSAPSHQ